MLGQREQDVAFVLFALAPDFAELVAFLAGLGLVAGGGAVAGEDVVELVEAGLEFVQVFAQVAVEDAVGGVAGVAVQVDEGVEAFFGALEQPVDGALFVGLQVVLVEVGEEVFARSLPSDASMKRCWLRGWRR